MAADLLDAEMAKHEITSVEIRLERMSEECAAKGLYALHYALDSCKDKLMIAHAHLSEKPITNGSTDNS